MKDKALFQGSATALVTPFAQGQVDGPALQAIVDYQLENGTAALVACGTTGEPATLTPQEREQVIRQVVKAAAGRAPVIAGTGSNNTQAVIDAAKRYQDTGCAAQLVVTPYYNKTTQEGLYRHFMEIAEKTTLPILLYNVPSRTTLDISPEVLQRLVDSGAPFVGLKESSYDFPLVMEKMRLVGDKLPFYSGNDDTAYPLMALGALGVVSVVGNALPRHMADMANSYLQGDALAARQAQLRLLPMVRAMFAQVSPIPCKAAMAMLGLGTDEVRLPLVPATDEVRQGLRQAFQGLGVVLPKP